MKIRIFFDKKNFLEISDITTFTYANGVFWYMDKKCVSHTIKNVVGVGSC